MSVCFKIGLVCAAIALACRIPMAYDIHAFDFAEASRPLPGRALEGDEMIEGTEAFRRCLIRLVIWSYQGLGYGYRVKFARTSKLRYNSQIFDDRNKSDRFE